METTSRGLPHCEGESSPPSSASWSSTSVLPERCGRGGSGPTAECGGVAHEIGGSGVAACHGEEIVIPSFRGDQETTCRRGDKPVIERQITDLTVV